MAPRLVLISTCGLAANAPPLSISAQTSHKNVFIEFPRSGLMNSTRSGRCLLCGALKHDAPFVVFPDPVLALHHAIGEVAACVVLLKCRHGHFVLAGIERERHVGEP